MTKRSYLIAAPALVLVVGAAIVVPAGARVHRATNGPPAFEAAQARQLAHAETAVGSVDFDSVPTVDGGTCYALTLPDNPNQELGTGGLSCGTGRPAPSATGMTAGMSWLQISGQNVLVIFGRVGKAITDVRLQMQDGSTVQAATSNGAYVTRMTAPAIGVLPGAITATGYDAAGRPAASVDLQKTLAASTPPAGSTP